MDGEFIRSNVYFLGRKTMKRTRILRNMKKGAAVLLSLGIIASLAGCSGTGTKDNKEAESTNEATEGTETTALEADGMKEEDTKEDITFTYARSASATSLDLHQEITMNNAFAIDKIFEPLVMFDKDGNIYDYLAESHEISEDGLVYTFKLRDGLKFSDGTDVTAEDVKFSFERHLSIGGALPLEADIKSIEAEDDKTVVITLGEAYTPFISEIANFSNGIIPKDFGGKTEEEFFKVPVGTGPFVVTDWDPTGDMTFIRNEYYWQGAPTVSKLIYKLVEDDNQAINQLKTGEVDAIEDMAFAAAEEIKNGEDTDTLTSNGWNVEELFFNTLDEHFKDVHVRRALAMAIDREALTASQTFGYGVTANTVLPAAIRYCTTDSVEALKFDIEAAKEELKKSAYPDGFDTSIIVSAGSNSAIQEAQIIQAAGQSIGINISVDQKESAAFRDAFKSLNYSMMINIAIADYPDANSIFAFQVDPEGFSNCYWTSYKSDEAVELLHKGQTAPDGEERAAVYKELQQILADEVPYIPLYYPEVVIGVRNDIKGLEVLPNGSANFNNVTRG